MPNQKSKRSYDHRLWLVFYESKDPTIFPELSIPESTRYTWCRKKPPEFVTHESFGKTTIELIAENEKLRKRFRICTAIIQVLKTVLIISGEEGEDELKVEVFHVLEYRSSIANIRYYAASDWPMIFASALVVVPIANNARIASSTLTALSAASIFAIRDWLEPIRCASSS